MTTLSTEFKRKVADLYLENREKLEKLDANTMDSFASNVLEMINKEKKKTDEIHDLKILEYNMGKLKNLSVALKQYKEDTDEYDFTRNDCKNIIDSTKQWLTLEKLI